MDLIPLGPGFGAEVRGAGLADVAARDDVYAAVRAAFEEHSVLIFRQQPITDELQVAYSQRFGPLETAKAASLGEGTPFSILTNIDRATLHRGRPWPDNRRPRHMVRTTISAADADGVAELRPARVAA